MKFIADLHIHSRFSMATSRSLNIPELSVWGAYKGINVLSTGDFTHPLWRQELKEWLVQDDNTGLFKTAKPIVKNDGQNIFPVSFMLGAEISSVYKKNGKTRKVHNLIFAPDFEAADKISAKLEKIGKISSDGRPILKLDSHDLLELILDVSERNILVPAHVWTPWYALFGSKSGFDKIEECFGDLTSHIFALETGLSSDPAMNRHLSSLDNFTLISNSDAHSGPNLGREANLFSGPPSWDGIFGSLKNAAKRNTDETENCKFLGTMEFYPEEGKYHLDGHRKCGVSLLPSESKKYGNKCPVCGKPLTIGVLNRVMELADRDKPGILPNEPTYSSLAPLTLILSQILGCGEKTSTVQKTYLDAISAIGPELDILCLADVEEIRNWWEPLGEAVDRMRQGKIKLSAGYDGEYGKISIFDKAELKELGKIRK